VLAWYASTLGWWRPEFETMACSGNRGDNLGGPITLMEMRTDGK